MMGDWDDEELIDALDILPGSRPQRDEQIEAAERELAAAAEPALIEAGLGMAKALPSSRGYPAYVTAHVGLARNGVEASGYVAGGELHLRVALERSWLTEVHERGLTHFFGLFIAKIISLGGDGYPDQVLAVRLVPDPLSLRAGASRDDADWVAQLTPAVLTWRDGMPSGGEWPPEPKTVNALALPAPPAVRQRPRRAALPYAADQPPGPLDW